MDRVDAFLNTQLNFQPCLVLYLHECSICGTRHENRSIFTYFMGNSG